VDFHLASGHRSGLWRVSRPQIAVADSRVTVVHCCMLFVLAFASISGLILVLFCMEIGGFRYNHLSPGMYVLFQLS
jgi:hypothetical protein